MTDILVRYLYQSWANFDAAVEGLSAAAAGARHDGASRIAWTAGHVTHMVDPWLNVNFQGVRGAPGHRHRPVSQRSTRGRAGLAALSCRGARGA